MIQSATTHATFMELAGAIACEQMAANEGGPFGAVIVKDGAVIATGHNMVTSTNDPTAHAEISAIRHACQHENDFNLSGAVIYTSCEPCPMCLSAIYWARIDAIYYANSRTDAAAIGFDDEFIYQQVALPIDQRSTPMVQVPDSQSAQGFY